MHWVRKHTEGDETGALTSPKDVLKFILIWLQSDSIFCCWCLFFRVWGALQRPFSTIRGQQNSNFRYVVSLRVLWSACFEAWKKNNKARYSLKVQLSFSWVSVSGWTLYLHALHSHEEAHQAIMMPCLLTQCNHLKALSSFLTLLSNLIFLVSSSALYDSVASCRVKYWHNISSSNTQYSYQGNFSCNSEMTMCTSKMLPPNMIRPWYYLLILFIWLAESLVMPQLTGDGCHLQNWHTWVKPVCVLFWPISFWGKIHAVLFWQETTKVHWMSWQRWHIWYKRGHHLGLVDDPWEPFVTSWLDVRSHVCFCFSFSRYSCQILCKNVVRVHNAIFECPCSQHHSAYGLSMHKSWRNTRGNLQMKTRHLAASVKSSSCSSSL